MWQWDVVVDATLVTLEARSLLRSTRGRAPGNPTDHRRPGPWDRAAVEIRLHRDTLHQWLAEAGEASGHEEELDGNLIVFSGNDYMCLSSHPAVPEAVVKAARDYGMGPRGSALICGYSSYHNLVGESWAELKKKRLMPHGTLVCGENGGGAAELFEWKNDIDIGVRLSAP
ncbi:8-amino-7-oxononanoate synthase [Zea mays]|uniref:Uncharacterized protein n=1 Tax=Zea mays TaxID=4577 RepID=A0A804R3R3_MAIZE|nr:8-amino-7-oxononanoate synthase [Zea mays]